MIVAITGGTGFIGRHLVARHVACGDQVRYLTRTTVAGPLPGAIPTLGSLNSPGTQLREFLDGADVLYHCAAELHNEALMDTTNVQGTSNLLKSAADAVGRWVQLSSTGVYGKNHCGRVSEDTDTEPANKYEITKLEADELIRKATHSLCLEHVILRPSNVYGPNMPNQSLFKLMKIIDLGLFFFVGTRKSIANYIHVENVVDALINCGAAELPDNGRKYIVSDHRTMEEFVGIIAESLGKSAPRQQVPEPLVRVAAAVASLIPGSPLITSRVDALVNKTLYVSDRIENELGFENRISMEKGISELTRYWKHGQS